MSLSAGAINSGPSALNERLCLVEPQIYQPSEPRLILLSAPSHPSPGRPIISRAHVNPIGSARRITWHRASSKQREISLVAAQSAILSSLWSGVQRRTAAYTGDFAHFSAKYQKPQTRWRSGVDSNSRFRLFSAKTAPRRSPYGHQSRGAGMMHQLRSDFPAGSL